MTFILYAYNKAMLNDCLSLIEYAASAATNLYRQYEILWNTQSNV